MQTAALVLAVIALALAGYGVMVALRLHRRFQESLGESHDKSSLASQLKSYRQTVEDTSARLDDLNKLYEELEVRSSVASQKISLVRFNPFGDTGGDQSFSLAVLDAHNSGYVLTSIHGRQGTRVYIKPLDFGKSRYSLSEEEQLAISQAMNRLPMQSSNNPKEES